MRIQPRTNFQMKQKVQEGSNERTGISRSSGATWKDDRGGPDESWASTIRHPVPQTEKQWRYLEDGTALRSAAENNLSNHEMQDSDRVMYEHSTDDGVFTVKEEFNDDNQDGTVMDNAHCIYKEHLHEPFEVDSTIGYAQRQPRPAVCMHVDGPNTSTTIPTIEPVTFTGPEATLPASHLSPVTEPQQTFELKNMLSKVLQKLESIDERLGKIEKRMQLAEASGKADHNNSNSTNRNYALNINKGATKLKFNFSVDVNDSNDDTKEDSESSEYGLQGGDSSSFTSSLNQTVQDEHREPMRINHNSDAESALFHQASALSLANEQRRHIESLHDLGPLLSSYATKPRQRYRQPCKSFIKKALSYYYTRQELATCRFRETSLGSVRRPPLSPKRMTVILEEAERVYPDQYRKLNIAEVVNSKCRKSKHRPQKEVE